MDSGFVLEDLTGFGGARRSGVGGFGWSGGMVDRCED